MANLIQNMGKLKHCAVFPYKGIEQKLLSIEQCYSHECNLRSLNPWNLVRLLWILNAFKPNLIYSHGKAAGLWGRLLARLTGIPVLHEFHGMHWRHYSFLLQWGYFLYERFMARWTQGFLFVSYGEMDEYELWVDVRKPCRVIPNGVNGMPQLSSTEREIYREELSLPDDIPVLASITRAIYQKNLEQLLRIHCSLLRTRPVLLLLFGVREEELEDYDVTMEQRLQLRCLHDEQEVLKKLQLADIYLSTSRWEGFSLGLIEALGLGIPAVVSPVTGNLDLLPLHLRGFRITGTNSVAEFKTHITELLDQPELLRKMAEASRAYILEHYHLDSISNKVEEFFREILGHPTEGEGINPSSEIRIHAA